MEYWWKLGHMDVVMMLWNVTKYGTQLCKRTYTRFCNHKSIPYRDNSGYELSQWEMMLQCNVAPHWLSPYPEWSAPLPGPYEQARELLIENTDQHSAALTHISTLIQLFNGRQLSLCLLLLMAEACNIIGARQVFTYFINGSQFSPLIRPVYYWLQCMGTMLTECSFLFCRWVLRNLNDLQVNVFNNLF